MVGYSGKDFYRMDENIEYAILTNEISRATFGKTVGEGHRGPVFACGLQSSPLASTRQVVVATAGFHFTH